MEDLIQRSINRMQTLNNLSDDLIAKKDFETAIHALEKELSIDPKSEDDLFVYIHLSLKENGYTEFDMQGTNENLLYGIASILAKMIINTKAPQTESTVLFLEQIKDDIKDIINNNAWGDNAEINKIIPFRNNMNI